jgi:hypothetical protein
MSRFIATLEEVTITRAEEFTKHGEGDQKPHGSWADGWDSVLSETSIETKVATFMKDNPNLTNQQISAFRSKTKKFFKNHDVVKKGDTVVTFQNKGDTKSAGVDAEDRSKILNQIDLLQENFPLKRIFILAQDGNGLGSTMGTTVKTVKGSAIVLNVFSLKVHYAFNQFSKKPEKVMPLDNKENGIEFTLSHEWGHAYNNANKGSVERVTKILSDNPSFRSSLSEYAKKSNSEGFAEIFAQNAIEIKTKSAKMEVTTAIQGVLGK